MTIAKIVMPVNSVLPEEDKVGKFNRMSASQANTWYECPRIWWYQSKMRLKFGQTPPLFLGRAVEECVTRVLIESPGLVMASAPKDVMSRGADSLLPLYDNEIPKDLMEWCKSRVEIHWPSICQEMHKEWSKNPRKAGNWHDYSMDEYKSMCVTALEMHLDEVLECQSVISDEELQDWRKGIVHAIPAPDKRTTRNNHPLAKEGSCHIVEAWEIARPWFVDPDSEKFSQNAIHPEHWFQGEYDVVYRHNSKIKIVDLKASRGKGDRSGNYVEQLRMYAMLWSKTHDGQIPNSLEVWYLGVGVKKIIQVPSFEEIEAIESDLKNLWDGIKSEEVSIDDCKPNPSPLRGYSEGGVSIEPPEGTRCDICEWSGLCPGGSGNDDYPDGGNYLPNGDVTEYELTPFDELEPRINIFCEVFSITKNEGQPPKIVIEKDGGKAFVKIIAEESEGQLTYDAELEKGDTVRLEGVIPSTNWKGEIELKVDPHARVAKSKSPQEGDIGLFDFKARWNVCGRVAYSTYKSGIGKGGKPWTRRGLVLLDHSGRVTVEGWDSLWPSLTNTLKQGDEIVVLNVSLDAWAIDVKANLEKGSSIFVLKRSED